LIRDEPYTVFQAIVTVKLKDGTEVSTPKTVTVHSQEIRECIQEPVQAVVEAVRRALEITPPELSSDIVDRGIVMTGGGALIRGLDVLLQQETGLPIHLDEDPMTCVVRGTVASSTIPKIPQR
jgi:actin-like ATPase involved in cell morphogenesis